MRAQELLDKAVDYIAEKEIDRYDSKDINPEYFYHRGMEISGMQELLDYLQDYLDDMEETEDE